MKRKNNALSLAIGALIGTVISVYAANQRTETEATPVPEKVTVRYVQAQVQAQQTAPPQIEVQEVESTYFDVNLPHDLQDHIFSECEKHNISPAIIIAIIERESKCDAQAVGDGGNSQGLMQIQRRWHEERMERLGCDDLLDPFQNVTVGIDYIAELKGTDDDLYWVLMAYNGGFQYANRSMEKGVYSDYALEVTERAAELENNKQVTATIHD